MNQNSHLPLSSFYFLERKAPSRPALADLDVCVRSHLARLNLSGEKLGVGASPLLWEAAALPACRR